MYQMSHVGPIIGQTGHFVNQAPEKIPYAIQRFVTESIRIVGVLDGALADREYLAGDYSIATSLRTPGSRRRGRRSSLCNPRPSAT
jgi:GST-like protein